MAERHKIALRLTGSELNETVRVKDFTNKLNQFVELLQEYDQAHTGGSVQYYKIGGLNYNSPPVAVPEAVAKQGESGRVAEMHESLLRGLQGISAGRVPEEFNQAVINKLNALCRDAKGRIKNVEIVYGTHKVDVGPRMIQQIEDILGGVTYAYGEVVGSLDDLTFHDKQNPHFVIYPTIGASNIPCYFDNPDLKGRLRENHEKLVTVRGVLVYKERSRYPVRIEEVRSVEPLEPSSHTLLEMFRSAPIPGALQRIREVRDAWDEA